MASAAVALLIAGVAPAHAQLAGSAALESDDRVRGLTFSHGQPALRLNLSYDHSGGGYAGLSLIGAQGYDGGHDTRGYTAWAGYISPRRQGLAWEAGLTHTHVDNGFAYDYSEVYAGVSGDHFSARLSYSPRYYAPGTATLYADVSCGRRLSSHWRVFAHAGALTPVSGPVHRQRYDVSTGMALSVSHYELQLAWVKSTPWKIYPGRVIDDGEAVVLSATGYF
ncbi:MAG TPA: hypothetical protein VG939_03715 [Caulobacteraceae bacterium]|nr:hypothetical protein [Caulobacteraceae bacterium]